MTPPARYRFLQVGALTLWSDRGDALHARELAYAFRERGAEPVLLNLPGPPAPNTSGFVEIRPPALPTRFLRQLSWNVLGTVAALVAMKRHQVKLIYSRMEPGIFVGVFAAAIGRCPLVVELNGLPSEDVRLYRPNNRLLLALTRAWERLMYRRAAMIVGAPGYIRYVQDHHGAAYEKCVVAPLGVNTEVFKPLDRRSCLKAKTIDDVPTVVWAGAIAGWQGLDTLVSAVEYVKDEIPGVLFILVGQGLLAPWLAGETARRGLGASVRLVGHVPYAAVNEYLGCASVCVGTFPGNRGDLGTISSLKTMTYLAAGRPVVTSAMDEMGPIIQSSGAGLEVPPDDAESLAVALKTLLKEDEAVWRGRCDASRKIAEDHTWGHKADTIVRHLDALVSD